MLNNVGVCLGFQLIQVCAWVFNWFKCVPGLSTDSWKISAVIGLELDPTTPASSSACKVFTFYPIYCHLSQSICEVCSCVDGQRLLNCCHIFKSSPGSQSISLLGVFLLDVLLGNYWAFRLVPHLPLLKQTKSDRFNKCWSKDHLLNFLRCLLLLLSSFLMLPIFPCASSSPSRAPLRVGKILHMYVWQRPCNWFP